MSEVVLRSIDKRAHAPRPRCEGTWRTEGRRERERRGEESRERQRKDSVDRGRERWLGLGEGEIAKGAGMHMERREIEKETALVIR